MSKILLGFVLLLVSAFALAGNYYLGATVTDAQAGKHSAIQLWNPTSQALCVNVVSIASSATNGRGGADIRSSFAPIGVLMGNGSGKVIGTISGAELRSDAFADNNFPIGAVVIYEVWFERPFNDRSYFFNPAIKIPANSGIIVTDANSSTYLIASFQFFDC